MDHSSENPMSKTVLSEDVDRKIEKLQSEQTTEDYNGNKGKNDIENEKEKINISIQSSATKPSSKEGAPENQELESNQDTKEDSGNNPNSSRNYDAKSEIDISIQSSTTKNKNEHSNKHSTKIPPLVPIDDSIDVKQGNVTIDIRKRNKTKRDPKKWEKFKERALIPANKDKNPKKSDGQKQAIKSTILESKSPNDNIGSKTSSNRNHELNRITYAKERRALIKGMYRKIRKSFPFCQNMLHNNLSCIHL